MADRPALLTAKLRALVDAPRAEPAVFPGGAALVDGSSVWLLLDVDPVTALGPALVWGARRRADDVTLLVDGGTEAGVIARRAALFSSPPTVLAVEGRSVVPAVAAPTPVPAEAPSAPELAELLVDADLEVVIEDGIVRGEVLGLEVARIVHGSTTSGTPIAEPVLEVGVGKADREMTALVHAGLPPVEQLARVRDIVLEQRRPGAERHPLNQLAPERWLRSVLVRDPARVGCTELHAAPPAVPRPNLRDPAVAIARGRHQSGDDTVVACSVGVLLDLVPAAADARAALSDGARLLLAVPERDAHPVTSALAERLLAPAELVPVADDWRA
ncbi:MAG: hypothetical protein ACJ739_05505 [Acidimicrobiales bacterium]